MARCLVAVRDAARTYRQGRRPVAALVWATCRVMTGDRIAVTGPSGSGKSTLLHLMGGLDRPSAGAVAWPALGPAESLRPGKVAFVFQGPSLLPALTVVENVALPLILGGAGVAAHQAAMAALERIGLASIASKLPEELSGGQSQRVAVARALAGRPSLLLADEPTGQLDAATADRLLDALLGALADSEAALVVATHDRSVADRMGQVWYMQRGVLVVPRDAHRVVA